MLFYRIPAEKIKVIYQGCDPAFAIQATAEKKEEVKTRYQLPEHFIISVGSIELRKNALSIVKAMPQMPAYMHLVLIGKRTSYTEEIDRFVSENSLGHRVHILNKVPFSDLPCLYQLADVFIYPSRYEGFGIPILEALNCRVPVIAATGSCLEEAGGPDSLYVSPFDTDGMAAAVRKTLEPEQRTRMIEAGVQWATQFSQEKLAQETMACYQQLLTPDSSLENEKN